MMPLKGNSMKTSTLQRLAATVGLCAATAGITLLAVRARAAGIPDADVLTYTGYLEGADGQPLTSELSSIGLEVWDAAQAGARVCDTSVEGVTPQAGRFQLVLPAECVDAVKATPDLWVDVKVEGASLGRTKLGAVPYAIEASHAKTADTALLATDATGVLAERIAAVEGALQHLAAKADVPVVSEWKFYAPALTTNTGTTVASATTQGQYRRLGDSVEVSLVTRFTDAPASGATWYHWSLPPGLSMDDAKLVDGGGTLGFGTTEKGPANNAALTVWRRSGTTVSASASGASLYYVNDTIPFAVGSGSYFTLHFIVPIQGWAAVP
jgi:hypothetical protein